MITKDITPIIPVVDVASLSYKTITFSFVLNVCATEPACEMTGFAVAKLMSVVTRQTLRGCYNNNEEASVNAVVHSRVKIGDMVNEVDLRSFIQLVLGV